MRIFYEYWSAHFSIGQLATAQLEQKKSIKKAAASIGQLPTAQLQFFDDSDYEKCFTSVGFTHHRLIIANTKTVEEANFYIHKSATEFWTVDSLKHHLANKLFKKKGKLPNNFAKTITNDDLRAKALQSFKDEYLLDFVNIEDPDEADERVIENEIVRNIKKFVHSLGNDFAFISNQYRLVVDEEEYFIDLLFFNRKLQSLIAFELKKGKFKPEYVGKLNFYLSALDEMVKQPHEQPSIGIILCKEKNNKTVEFSFKDMSKPMGVATYKTTKQLPKQYKNILPSETTLKKLMT